MSTSIDNRIVEMQFNNQQFEKNIQTSTKSLEKLQETLNLKRAGTGINDLQNTVSRFSLDGMATAIDTINERFSLMGVAAMTVISNITTSAMNMASNVMRQFTLEPIQQGFGEYELKMGSVQTIMASTGADLQTVMGHLNELNTYADKTIYSFSDMTSSIGKFTNAGVKLEDAVAAIQGISNEAAVSGANAQQASHAMYNFAQALSAGYVKLIDWKSIENANMATVEFKQQLLDTAEAVGTVKKGADGMYEVLTENGKGAKMGDTISSTRNFNDSLSYQWMTTEVLTKTLAKYADETTDIGKKAFAAAQDVKTFSQLMDTMKEAIGSGWATTFELIIGNFDEAKELWTSVSNVLGGLIEKTSDARNAIFQAWHDSVDGRQAVLEGLSNSFFTLHKIMLVVKSTFFKVFPPASGKVLIALSAAFRDLTAKMIPGTETIKKMGHALKGFFSVFSLAGKVISAIGRIIKDFATYIKLGKGAGKVFGGILGFFGKIGDFFSKLNAAASEGDKIYETMKKFFSLILPGFGDAEKKVAAVTARLNPLKEAFMVVRAAISGFFDGLRGKSVGVAAIFESFDTIFDKLKSLRKEGIISADRFEFLRKRLLNVKSAIVNVRNNFSNVGESIRNAFSKVGTAIKSFFAKIREAFRGEKKAAKGDKVFSIGDVVASALESMKTEAPKIGRAIADFFGSINWDTVNETLRTGFLGVLALSLGKMFRSLAGIFKAFKSGINEVSEAIGDTVGIFGTLSDTLKSFQKEIHSRIILHIAIAMGILAASLIALSFVPADRMKTAIIGLAAACGVLVSVLTTVKKLFGQSQATSGGLLGIFQNLSGGTTSIPAATTALVKIAVAMVILAVAVKKLSDIKPDKLWNGIAALGALTTVLAYITKLMSNNTDGMSKMSGLFLAFSVSAVILAGALSLLALLSWEGIAKGLVAIGAVFTGLGILVHNTKDADVGGLGGAILKISVAMLVFTASIAALGRMRPDRLVQGLVAFSFVLFSLVTALKSLPPESGFKGPANGLITLAAAMYLMTFTISRLGKMDGKTLAKGLIGLTAALFGLCLALRAMPKGSIKTAAAILILAPAMLIFAKAISVLGSLSLGSLVKGLIGLVGALGLVVIAAAVMKKNIVGAAALVVMSVGVLALSAALAVLSKIPLKGVGVALLALAGAFVIMGLAGYVLAPVSPILLALGAAMTLLGIGVLGISVGLATLLPVLAASALSLPVIATMIVSSIRILLQGIGQMAGDISAAVTAIIVGIADAITKSASGVAESIWTMIETMIATIEQHIPRIVDLGMSLIAGILQGIADHIGDIATAASDIIINFLNAISEKSLEISQAGSDCIFNFINGIADGIRENTQRLTDALANLTSAIVEGFFTLLQGAVRTIPGIGPILDEKLDEVKTNIREQLAPNSFEQMGSDAVSGTVTGIQNSRAEVQEAAAEVGTSAKESLNESLESGENSGTSFVDNLIGGIGDNLDLASESGTNIGDSVISGLDLKLPDMESAGIDLSDSALDGVDSLDGDFKSSGWNAGEGLALGLEDKTGRVRGAASSLGQTALSALNNYLDIHSPSRKFGESGKYSVLGFAQYLIKNAGYAADAAREMGQTALDSLKDAISGVGDLASGSFTDELTIKPLVDLSNVENAAGRVQGLFADRSYQLAGVLGSVRYPGAASEIGTVVTEAVKAAMSLATDDMTSALAASLEMSQNVPDTIVLQNYLYPNGAKMGEQTVKAYDTYKRRMG